MLGLLAVPLMLPHSGQECNGQMRYLIEISGCKLPGLGCKVDVVAVMHLGKVVEAAGLHQKPS